MSPPNLKREFQVFIFLLFLFCSADVSPPTGQITDSCSVGSSIPETSVSGFCFFAFLLFLFGGCTPSNGSDRRFQFCCLHHPRNISFGVLFFPEHLDSGSAVTPPPTGQITDSCSVNSSIPKATLVPLPECCYFSNNPEISVDKPTFT